MAKIACKIEEQMVEDDRGVKVRGVEAVCGKCGNKVCVFGTSIGSRRRALATLRENCEDTSASDRGHYYVDADGESEY